MTAAALRSEQRLLNELNNKKKGDFGLLFSYYCFVLGMRVGLILAFRTVLHCFLWT